MSSDLDNAVPSRASEQTPADQATQATPPDQAAPAPDPYLDPEQNQALAISLDYLSPMMVKAADELARGRRINEVAALLGIDRSTLYRWKIRHPAFIAAVNRRQRDMLEGLSFEIGETIRDAVQEVGKAMKSKRSRERRFDAALAILRTFGTKKLLRPAGPVTHHGAVREMILEKRLQTGYALSNPVTHEETIGMMNELTYELRDLRAERLAELEAQAKSANPPPAAENQEQAAA